MFITYTTKRYRIPTDKPWVATDPSTSISGFGKTKKQAIEHLMNELRRARRIP